jgi:hypothetical protein
MADNSVDQTVGEGFTLPEALAVPLGGLAELVDVKLLADRYSALRAYEGFGKYVDKIYSSLRSQSDLLGSKVDPQNLLALSVLLCALCETIDPAVVDERVLNRSDRDATQAKAAANFAFNGHGVALSKGIGGDIVTQADMANGPFNSVLGCLPNSVKLAIHHFWPHGHLQNNDIFPSYVQYLAAAPIKQKEFQLGYKAVEAVFGQAT